MENKDLNELFSEMSKKNSEEKVPNVKINLIKTYFNIEDKLSKEVK